MRLSAAILAQLVLPALLLGPAHGYCPKRFTDSAPGVNKTIWQPGPDKAVRVAFSDTLDAEKIAAIKAAFQSWADVACSTLAFEFLDDSGQLFKLADISYAAPSATLAEIYVFWIDGSGEPPDFVGGFENVISHTFPRHDGNGKLTTASIAMNAATATYRFEVLTEDNLQVFDVQTVMTQLLGEVLGLTSSDLTTGTVMTKGVISSGLGERAPLEDDQDALQYLYWDESCTEEQRPPNPGADPYCYPTPPADASVSDSAPASDGGIDTDASASDGGPDAPTSCTSTEQCGPGQLCTIDGECVSIGEDDGCSCSAASDPLRGALGLMALFGLALLQRRRGHSS